MNYADKLNRLCEREDGLEKLKGITLELAEALRAYSTTGYENRSAGSHAEHIERQIEEIRAKTAREALAKLEKELGDEPLDFMRS